MSLKAVCQVLLYFESFKNWDLNDQGIYLVKAKLEKQSKKVHRFATHSEKKELASPYHMLNIRKELRSRKKNKIRGENSIDDTQYRTKAFFIKFNDEQIDLDEAVIFRIELDTFPELDSQGLFLVFDLYFAMQFYFQSEQGDKQLGYTKVATAKLRLNNIETGFAQYSSLGFGEYYRGNVNVSVFSLLMDYKFRIYRCPKLENDKTPKQKAREKLDNLNGYYLWLWNYAGLTPQQFYDSTVKHIRYHSYHACVEWSKAVTTPIPVKLALPKYCLPGKSASSDLVDVDEQTFSAYLGTYKLQQFDSTRFQQQLQGVLIASYTFFQEFIKQLEADQLKKHLLQDRYHESMKERCGEFIFRQEIREQDLTSEKLSGRQKRAVAKKIRKAKYPNEQQNLQDVNGFPKRSEQPVLFHQISQLKPSSPPVKNQNVLYVLCHGFQGSSYDMLNVKNLVKQFYPKAYYLVARSNEGQTEGDVLKMGERLAKEIERCIRDEEIEKDLQINMIGHSMGGIILRAALPYLEEYRNCLGTFMTFGSPHLGYLQGIKTMIKTGLWFIKSWNKTFSLEQLTLSDSKTLHETALYKLSKSGSLRYFKNVVLLSSYEDNYTPWHSARIHNYKPTADDDKSIIEKNMVHNILEGGCLERIHRIDVSFQISETNVDSVIGRTAHMRFLTDENVLRMILYCMPDIFG